MLRAWESRPRTTLAAFFLAWKAFLLAIAAGSCVGPSYDTSASLVLLDHHGDGDDDGHGALPLGLATLVRRLTSWDAVYYVQAARRGYLYEQEWAFGSGLPLVVSGLQRALASLGLLQASTTPVHTAAVAILLSHAAHLLAALALLRLARQLTRDPKLAFVAASLHVVSPAGLFLSAPYAESSFAFLAFAGFSLFVSAVQSAPPPPSSSSSSSATTVLTHAVLVVLSGALLGLATAFRSNGLVNGVAFAYFAALAARRVLRRPPSLAALVGLAAYGAGGALVAAGSVVPQYFAFRRYCVDVVAAEGQGLRPWCMRLVPSIYGFVQEHYWNNGLLRYWTLSNLPLFLIAAPMVSVLLRSGVVSLKQPRPAAATTTNTNTASISSSSSKEPPVDRTVDVLWCLAAAQLALAAYAVLFSHVQIVSRVASGLPLWYMWLARGTLFGAKHGLPNNSMVTFMIMYGCVQGVLFASFLPPA